MQEWMVEAIGYTASGLIAVSLIMVSVLKLRIINLLGSLVFVIYGGLIGSVPLMLTNMFIIGINAVHLRRLRVGAEGLRYQEMDSSHLAQVEDFARSTLGDIHRFFPRFVVEQVGAAAQAGGTVFAAVRHLKVVGFAVVFPTGEAEQVLDRSEQAVLARQPVSSEDQCFLIDYILPRYRDLGLVRGLHELVIHRSVPAAGDLLALADDRSRRHAAFLQHNGFSRIAGGDGVQLFRKSLGATPVAAVSAGDSS